MFNLEFSMKRESNSVKFGYPTLIWLQDYLNLENSFFKGNYLLSKASSIAPNMPSCFLKDIFDLRRCFRNSGLLRFNITQVSVNYTKKRTKIFQTFFTLVLASSQSYPPSSTSFLQQSVARART